MNAFHLKSGLNDAMPLVIVFFPIAMAFGMVAKTTGISFADTCLFSLLVLRSIPYTALGVLIIRGILEAPAEIQTATIVCVGAASLCAWLGKV